MARMHPAAYPRSLHSEASGEQRVFEILASLKDEVAVFYEPPIPTLKGVLRPDFVVVHPEIGVIVLEVKRWHTLLDANGDHVLVAKSNGETSWRRSPLRQVRDAQYALKEHLEAKGFGHPKLAFPVASAVVWLGSHPEQTPNLAARLGGVPSELLDEGALSSPSALAAAISRIPRPFLGRVTVEDQERITELFAGRTEPLKEHVQARAELRTLFAALQQALPQDAAPTRRNAVKAIGAELDEASMKVVFVGSFSSGKSTVLNALLPGLALPTRATPTTAVPTMIRAGEHLRLAVSYRTLEEQRALDELLSEAEPLPAPEHPGQIIDLSSFQELAAFIGEGQTSRQLRSAVVEFPSLELPHGIALVDLPGSDSTDPYHALVAEQFLAIADHVVCLLDATHPLGETERLLLEKMASVGRALGPDRVTFFLNKADLVVDAAALVTSLRETLSGELNVPAPRIFFGSAGLASLAARDDHDASEKREGNRMCRKLARAPVPAEEWRRVSRIDVLARHVREALAASSGRLLLQTFAERMLMLAEEARGDIAPLIEASATTRQSFADRAKKLGDSVKGKCIDPCAVRIADEEERLNTELRKVVDGDLLAAQLRATLKSAGAVSRPKATKRLLVQAQSEWLDDMADRVDGVVGAYGKYVEGVLGEARDRVNVLFQEEVFDGHVRVGREHMPYVLAGDLPYAEMPALEVGIGGGVLAGAIMGFSAGSVFPGVGNAVGAVMGAAMAGLGIWSGTRLIERGDNASRFDHHAKEVADRLLHVANMKVSYIARLAVEFLKNLEASAKERVQRIVVAARPAEAEHEALRQTEATLKTFLANLKEWARRNEIAIAERPPDDVG